MSNEYGNLKFLAKQVKWSKYIIVLIIFFVALIYFSKFGGDSFSESKDAWGQFGDYFGGILNPIISFGAFYWLATSILLQKAELSETREALKATQEAQQQQADTALITAKIQRDNIRLSIVGSQLASLRTYRIHLLEVQAKNGPSGHYFDETGKLTSVNLVLEKTNSKIAETEMEEAECFGQVVKQSKELRQDVASSYNNGI